MLRKFILSFLTLLFFCCTAAVSAEKPLTIGIIIPMEHRALNDIVAGFKKSLAAEYPHPIRFNVQNAQGDIKLQRAILERFLGQKVDMIVPVGTPTTLMALTLVKKAPIISLAADYSEAERQKLKPRNITGILDAVDPKKKLDLIKSVFPKAQKIAVIYHSANERNLPELERLESEGAKLGIAIQKIAVQTLPELQSASRAIASDASLILILKDHLIASGIRILVPIAEQLKLPLVTSDDGTVYEGAALALAVRETSIGEAGGVLAAKVLKGKPIEDLPMQDIETLTVFYNPSALAAQKIDISLLEQYAKENHYGLVARDFHK